MLEGLRQPARLIGTVVMAVSVVAGRAMGQGFGLNDVGSCAVARAYAATGAPCRDASAIYWNPGAAAELSGFSASIGDAGIGVRGGFTADTSLRRYPGAVPESYPPHFFANYGTHLWGRPAAVGIGVYVPYGLTSQWHNDFPGRFVAQKASLQSIYIQPNFAIQIVPHKLSIGGGPIIGVSTVELDQALDLSSTLVPLGGGITFGQLGVPAGTQFGTASLKGSTTAYGWTLGAHYLASRTVQFGARFLSPLYFNYSGATAHFKQVPTGLVLAANNPLGLPAGTPLDAVIAQQFATGGPLVTQGASTKITHPLQAEAGVGYTGIARTLIDVDVAYVNWSSFKTLPLVFTGPAGVAGANQNLLEAYGNSWSGRVGVERVFGDTIRSRGITARAGFSYASTPAPPVTVTPILPDMNRYNGGVGLGIPLTRELGIDLSYLHVFTEGRRGRVVERTSAAYTAAQVNSGWYDLAADVLSLSLRLHY